MTCTTQKLPAGCRGWGGSQWKALEPDRSWVRPGRRWVGRLPLQAVNGEGRGVVRRSSLQRNRWATCGKICPRPRLPKATSRECVWCVLSCQHSTPTNIANSWRACPTTRPAVALQHCSVPMPPHLCLRVFYPPPPPPHTHTTTTHTRAHTTTTTHTHITTTPPHAPAHPLPRGTGTGAAPQ